MFHVKQVNFDDDDNVDLIHVQLGPVEYAWIYDHRLPADVVWPLTVAWSAKAADELFTKAGKMSGNDPDYAASNAVYYGLATVVDKLIRDVE